MSEKSTVRCATQSCIDAITKYGAHYHSVHPTRKQDGSDATDRCERCGGVFNGSTWLHKCKKCGTEVEPGKLTGLFVPHSCHPCMEKVYEQERKAGRICGRCKGTMSQCCC